jgi:hypothetical protein
MAPRTFQIALIKPSHYDDSSYVIQWRRVDPGAGAAELPDFVRAFSDRIPRTYGAPATVAADAAD